MSNPFNIQQALQDCRKAYDNKTLQFQMPREQITSRHCRYFTEHEGKTYTCAVGAICSSIKSDIVNDGLNEGEAARAIFMKYTTEFALDKDQQTDLRELQIAHDKVVSAIFINNNTCKDETQIEFKEKDFVEGLSRLETKYLVGATA